MATFSSLVSATFSSPNCSTRGGLKVCKFTPHHMGGNLSIESCADIFAESSRQASANYLIGTDGRTGGDVPEELRAWTTSSKWNDQRAITVEVANASGAPNWTISQAAWDALVRLGADVCDRYGFRLNYTGDKYGSLTEHRLFSATSCPGPFLHGQLSELATQVNAILDGAADAPSIPQSGGVVTSTYSSELGYHAWWGAKFSRALQEQLGTKTDGIISEQPTANKKYFWAVDGGVTYGTSGSDAIEELQRRLKAAGYDPNGIDRRLGKGCITALQRCLADAGYYKGDIDGYMGHQSNEAFASALLDEFFRGL